MKSSVLRKTHEEGLLFTLLLSNLGSWIGRGSHPDTLSLQTYIHKNKISRLTLDVQNTEIEHSRVVLRPSELVQIFMRYYHHLDMMEKRDPDIAASMSTKLRNLALYISGDKHIEISPQIIENETADSSSNVKGLASPSSSEETNLADSSASDGKQYSKNGEGTDGITVPKDLPVDQCDGSTHPWKSQQDFITEDEEVPGIENRYMDLLRSLMKCVPKIGKLAYIHNSIKDLEVRSQKEPLARDNVIQRFFLVLTLISDLEFATCENQFRKMENELDVYAILVNHPGTWISTLCTVTFDPAQSRLADALTTCISEPAPV